MPRYLVYRITCLANDKRYIGITSGPLIRRWTSHLSEARRPDRPPGALQRSIRKYGAEAFTIEVMYEAVDQREACMVERALVAAYGTMRPHGYNLTTGGERNVEASPATRLAISEAQKGLKRSEETRNRMREAQLRRSAEVQEKMTAGIIRSRTFTPEWRANMSAAKKALAQTPEGYARMLRMTELARAKPRSAEATEKVRLSQIGGKRSDETREKMRISALAHWANRKRQMV